MRKVRRPSGASHHPIEPLEVRRLLSTAAQIDTSYGQNGGAMNLANPEYQALIDEIELDHMRCAREGRPYREVPKVEKPALTLRQLADMFKADARPDVWNPSKYMAPDQGVDFRPRL